MGRTRKPAVIDARDRKALAEFFSKHGQMLLPLLELIERGQSAVNEVIDVLGRAALEALLVLSAEQVAGPKVQGQRSGREIYWYGSQQGEVTLSDRKLKVTKPRLRRRGRGTGGEVEIPAYTRMSEGGIADHVLRLLMRGVSTRRYQEVLPEMADTAGVSKSQVSREWIEASAKQLELLQTRRLEVLDLLVIYIDGMVFGDHHVLAAVGVDRAGTKYVLGIAPGSSENYQVAKDLLCDLVERGLGTDRLRLFVVDGSKALRKAIVELFGPNTPIQRCRAHKLRNVTERLPKEERPDTARRMRAAYLLEEKDGTARLRKLAQDLEQRGHVDAARSLLEGLEDTFTINRLGLSASLRRCLASTNIIENPNGGVRARCGRVTRWKDPKMILRWCAAAFLECEARFRKISGHADLWMLEAKLRDLEAQHRELASADAPLAGDLQAA